MTDPTSLTLAAARDALRGKKLSARELTDAHLVAIEAARPLNAYVLETPDQARAMADQADMRLRAGEARALDGIPLGIKDLFCTKDVRATAGSKILENFVPTYESTVTANLWRDGAVMLGKLNNDEFAMGSSNETSYFGPVVSPWRREGSDTKLVPGGSSGGSAAAVAANLCLGATATDTGGSIRQPASLCGVVGMKPTYGLVSRFGLVAFASSLDQIGPITKDVTDCAALLQAIAGHDPMDSTSVDKDIPDYAASLDTNIRGLRVGLLTELMGEGIQPEVADAVKRAAALLSGMGAEVRDVSLPHVEYALSAYYLIAPAEASSNLARYDGVRYGHRTEAEVEDLADMYKKTRAEGFGDEVKRRIMLGTYALSAGYYEAYYGQAQKVRTLIVEDFNRAFADVDVIISPVSPTTAFKIGEKTANPLQMYLSDICTIPVNLAGLPGISLPCGVHEGLPIGLQIIGKAFDEPTVLRTAYAFETAYGFKERPLL